MNLQTVNSDKLLDSRYYLEIMLAIVRISEKPEPPAEFYPLATEIDASKFVYHFFSESEVNSLVEIWKLVGSNRIISWVLGYRSINYNSEIMNNLKLMEELLMKIDLVDLISYLTELYSQLNIKEYDIQSLLEMSQYNKTEYHVLKECKNLQAVVVDSIFLQPAPLGKYGYYDTDLKIITLVKGYHGALSSTTTSEYLSEFADDQNDFIAQWYRMGIWHAVARTYWQTQIDKIKVDNETFFTILEEICRMKFIRNGRDLVPYKDVKEYFMDHLIHASKVVAEQQLFNSDIESADINKRTLHSWGLFLFDWFVEELHKYTEESEGFASELSFKWIEQAKNLKFDNVNFEGPIGACSAPLWKHNIRLVFSPSIDAKIRRGLRIWIAQNWGIKVSEVSVDEPYYESDQHCDLVFALNEDAEWITPIVRNLSKQLDLSFDKGIRGSFLLKRDFQKKYWTKVCIADIGTEITELHKNANFNYDYSFITNGTYYRGLYDWKSQNYERK